MELASKLRRLDRSALKIIALIVMTVGHFFIYTLPEIRCFGVSKPWSWMMCYVAYMAPPIFFFFIAEGFRYTHSRKAYAVRLLIFAVLTQLAGSWFPDAGLDRTHLFDPLNVFFTLLFGFLDLWILTSGIKAPLKLLAVGGLLTVSYLLHFEWEITGQLFIIAYYYCKDKPLLNFGIAAALALFDLAVMNGSSLFYPKVQLIIAFLLLGAAAVLFCYNGKKGRDSRFLKYFFYAFYPLHLLLINIVKAACRS